MKSKLLTLLCALGLPTLAFAQARCDTPVVSILANGKPVKELTRPLPSSLVVLLAAPADCPAGEFGQFTPSAVEVALVRDKGPVKGTRIAALKSDKISLTDWAKLALAGDRIVLEVREYDVTTPTGPDHRKAENLIVTLPVK